jgi:septum formation protein
VPDLILASGSTWRQQMLAGVGIRASCVPSGVDEDPGGITDPVELARTLAARKAQSVLDRHPQAWVLGADQVACDAVEREQIWGKPLDPADHLARLTQMRGRTHLLITGWVLMGRGVDHVAHCTTAMRVRADLTDKELADYVATGEGGGCAAGYMAEGRGAFLFEEINGDWYNVLGLPLFDVIGVLRGLGWRFEERP